MAKPEWGSIESGDLRGGFGFLLPVRKLEAEIIPLDRKPPGNSREFQASEAFLPFIDKTFGFVNELPPPPGQG